MPGIGPQLPPHLAKRKRTSDDGGSSDDDAHAGASGKVPRRGPLRNDDVGRKDGDGDDGSSRVAAPHVAIGPSLPPSLSNHDEINLSDADSDTGPAPAPQEPRTTAQHPPSPPTNDQPPPSPSNSSSSDDDDYGPSLPSARQAPTIGPSLPPSTTTAADAAPQRDSWMLAPPPAAEGYSERDPTRIRARKFASKPSSSATPGTAPSIWTETPEEKLRRLQNAVLGREDPAAAAADGPPGAARSALQEERDRKIAANIEAQRGSSLYDEHSKKRRHGAPSKGEEDDDPSSRPFDRDKDMALGGKIGTAKRRELVSRAADFGGKFQKGSYL
ncbi:hypothetical protein HIM_09059 [Hirsutella minnesotensis 3608]|uniref:DUF3752 domain-containing protein n=1 Tax=Hirsutella minnesotensis 3608 TaxID=1043627 RepID=A0A0F7ZGU9_9HYPO|nr:hypothetical protein HIM_09059 [Hirsutella minnesotensis 3608]